MRQALGKADKSRQTRLGWRKEPGRLVDGRARQDFSLLFASHYDQPVKEFFVVTNIGIRKLALIPHVSLSAKRAGIRTGFYVAIENRAFPRE